MCTKTNLAPSGSAQRAGLDAGLRSRAFYCVKPKQYWAQGARTIKQRPAINEDLDWRESGKRGKNWARAQAANSLHMAHTDTHTDTAAEKPAFIIIRFELGSSVIAQVEGSQPLA